MNPSDLRWLQSDLLAAHAEARTEDARRRYQNALGRQDWVAKGGPEAEEKHFEWLRVQPLEAAK